MITCYFGIPGVGKTTLLAKLGIKELKRIRRGKSRYKAVYSNFECKGLNKIQYADLKSFKMYDCLLLFDEMTLDADNRNFKNFDNDIRDFFILHRHFGVDIVYATQNYDKVDLKIRTLTQDLWYMSRTVVPLLCHFTVSKRIYRNIAINEYTSDLIMGYRFCNLIERFFASNFRIVFRPFYYKYFDSYDEGRLSERPVLPVEQWDELPPNKILECLNKLAFKEKIG